MLGDHLIKSWSPTQSLVSLSSGEAEYYGMVTAIANALGDVALAADWGVRLEPQIHMDATAGISIGSRRGLGRVKHIDTVFLWVQEVVNRGRVRVDKKSTHEMIADVLTKAVTEVKMESMMTQMNYHYCEGRHKLALGS